MRYIVLIILSPLILLLGHSLVYKPIYKPTTFVDGEITGRKYIKPERYYDNSQDAWKNRPEKFMVVVSMNGAYWEYDSNLLYNRFKLNEKLKLIVQQEWQTTRWWKSDPTFVKTNLVKIKLPLGGIDCDKEYPATFAEVVSN